MERSTETSSDARGPGSRGQLASPASPVRAKALLASVLVALAILGSLLVLAFVPAILLIPRGEETLESWEGRPAPDLEILVLDGQILRLSHLKGRRVFLNFWATWCQPCAHEMPHLERLARQYPSDRLLIIGISDEAPSVLRLYVREKGIGYPIGTLASVPAPFSQIQGVPTTFVVDRDGMIDKVLAGYHSYQELTLHAAAAAESDH